MAGEAEATVCGVEPDLSQLLRCDGRETLMIGRRVSTTLAGLVLVALISAVHPDSSSAQAPARVRVAVPAARVLDAPRSRADMVTTVLADSVFEVLARDGDWYWIVLPPDNNGTSRPGYIEVANVAELTAAGDPVAPARPIETRMQSRQPLSTAAERGGFTLLVDLGVGIQKDDGVGDSAAGVAGLNVGVGAFLTKNLALMFRFSGTDVSYDRYSQVSGVVGPMVQYWLSDRINVRAGGGLGFWSSDDQSDHGFGLILGAGVTVFNRGKHNLQVGFEYAPAFTDGKVHNFGITFGYQLL
jgi:hypothetical protein